VVRTLAIIARAGFSKAILITSLREFTSTGCDAQLSSEGLNVSAPIWFIKAM
jgi:hypothetical protein